MNKYIPARIVYIIGIAILILILFSFGYFLGQKGKTQSGQTEVTISPQDLGAGEIGEILIKDEASGEEEPLVSSTMPPVIFSTTGVILDIESNGIAIRGSGTNFADNFPRDLTVIFTAETKTFNKNQSVSWKGEIGLSKLEKGMEVLVEGYSNIRGKAGFEVKTVNILQ